MDILIDIIAIANGTLLPYLSKMGPMNADNIISDIEAILLTFPV